jgi:predicted dehydrogenase
MTTRVLVVGAGGVGRRHAGVLAGLEGVEVAGVVDPVVALAESLAAEHDAPSYAEVEDALERVGPDAVYICVPPFAHGEPERAALERGLPIFVEKPVALDPATAEDIARRVEKAGVVTGTGYHWRCLDVLPRARALLADRPAVSASGYWLDKRPPVSWWARADRSGGQVVEQLTHVLDLARALLGDAHEVYAAGARLGSPSPDWGDIDDATAATVRFASGAVATFSATSLLATKHRASLHTYSLGLALEVSETGLAVDHGNGNGRQEYPAAEDPRVTVDREFIEAVRGQRSATRTPYGDALESHRLACAVAQSAREGRAVRLGPGTEVPG